MNTDRKNIVYRLTVGGLLLAVGIVIPRLFHIFGTPELGKMFLPMHLSVFIAGIYLGMYYGATIGFLTPLVNSLFGMPMFPFNLIMAFELAAYGLFAGLFMYLLQGKRNKRMGRTLRVTISMILSMILGRVVYGFMLFVAADIFGLQVPAPLSVISSALTGLPGIIIQLFLLPGIIYALLASQEKYIF